MIQNVTDYLERTAEQFPDKSAVVDKSRSLTFAALREEARHIATALADKELFKKPVAVFMEKSAECIASFLGVAYSGNFYTPIDTNMPRVRIEKILSVLNPAAIITDEVHEKQAAEFIDTAHIIIYKEAQQETIGESRLMEISSHIIDTDVLYVFFTSGSTGTPKGVIVSHRAVIDFTEWGADTFHIDEKHVLGNQGPLYFDLSIFDVYQMLKTGAELHLIPENLFMFPPMLLDYLNEKHINTLFWVPSALCIIANVGIFSSKKLPDIRKVFFCGEVMPNKQLNIWRNAYPDVMYVNLYGPTESVDACTYYVVDRPFADSEPLPIGIPCKNTDVLVLDENDNLVKDNKIGELCIRGTCLAYGYYNQIEKTAEVFVQNPLNKAYSETIYRTGDLVRYNERGELVYVSRKDFQIKHMGYRIELGEIETAVSALPGVDMNCCLYDMEKSMIVLFYKGDKKKEELPSDLKQNLPAYMVPQRIERLDDMPLNLNGKIDRVELKNKL